MLTKTSIKQAVSIKNRRKDKKEKTVNKDNHENDNIHEKKRKQKEGKKWVDKTKYQNVNMTQKKKNIQRRQNG
jgi:hypothetical protein